MKILGIDHGNARIGVAISDTTGSFARPFKIVKHISRAEDATSIADIAKVEDCQAIVVGIPLDSDGSMGPRARSVNRFIEELQTHTALPITAWDESHSTQQALSASIARGEGKKKRQNAMDDQAAAIILQDYLDNHCTETVSAVDL